LLNSLTHHVNNKTLEFSHNWNNKLHCTAFTSLRLSDRFNVNDQVDIYLKHRRLGTAVITGKIKTSFHAITDGVAYIDTGYPALKCREILQTMYKNIIFTALTPIYLYVVVYNEKEIEGVPGSLFD
jgi:hypothetical protein